MDGHLGREKRGIQDRARAGRGLLDTARVGRLGSNGGTRSTGSIARPPGVGTAAAAAALRVSISASVSSCRRGVFALDAPEAAEAGDATLAIEAGDPTDDGVPM